MAIHEHILIPYELDGQTFHLGSDKHNFVIGKRVKNKNRGNMEWDGATCSYYPNLSAGLLAIQRQKIKNIKITTFEQLQAAIHKTADEIMGLYEGLTDKELS